MKTRKMMKVMTAACLAVLTTAFAGCGKKEAATSGQGGKIEYKLAYHYRRIILWLRGLSPLSRKSRIRLMARWSLRPIRPDSSTMTRA